LKSSRAALIVLALAIALAAAAAACTDRPSDAELDAWRREADDWNARLVLAHGREAREREAKERDWTLVVSGQTGTGKDVRLKLADLEPLATTRVRTTVATDVADKKVVEFRGVRLQDLLERAGMAPGVSEVTCVAFDAYRATVPVEDIRRYPILLALERDGQPIPRKQGGPLCLVFPESDHKELRARYTDKFWAWYVTHVIVGTETVRLRVGGREIDLAALDALAQISFEGTVGYKLHWPKRTMLHGVRLRDALAAAGLALAPGGAVVVRGKPPVDRDPANPLKLDAADVLAFDILLATRYDDDRRPIPARLGGPVTLALPAQCAAKYGDRRWITFVEEVESAP